MKLAPIVILTYSRLNHLNKTIKSLKKNSLAEQSDLYFLIDGPKHGDEEKVKKIKDYAYSVKGFKKIYVIARKPNSREDNYFNGADKVLNKYEKMIFLEDDNVVSETFLKYMNDALEYFKDNRDILAISGYNVPAKFPNNYNYAYYKSSYFNTWGYGTWLDRKTLDMEKYSGQYIEISKDRNLHKKIRKKHPKLI